MNHRVVAAVMLAQFMDLSMTIVAAGDAVIGSGGFDLLVFDHAKLETLLLEARLEESAAAAAAKVVGAVGLHVDEILFTYDGFDHIAQIFGDGIAVAFPNDLTRVLYREFDLQVLVPVGIDLQFAFTNPFGIVLIDVLNFEVVFDVEFFQSGPD